MRIFMPNEGHSGFIDPVQEQWLANRFAGLPKTETAASMLDEPVA